MTLGLEDIDAEQVNADVVLLRCTNIVAAGQQLKIAEITAKALELACACENPSKKLITDQ